MKRIFVFLAVVAPLAATLFCWKVEIVDLAYDFAGKAPNSQEFATSCLTGINERRQQQGATPLEVDEGIQTSLESCLASAKNASDIELDNLLSYLQRSHPNVTSLSATMVWHPASMEWQIGKTAWCPNSMRSVPSSFATDTAVAVSACYPIGCHYLI